MDEGSRDYSKKYLPEERSAVAKELMRTKDPRILDNFNTRILAMRNEDERLQNVREICTDYDAYMLHVLDADPLSPYEDHRQWTNKLEHILSATAGVTLSTSTVREFEGMDDVIRHSGQPQIGIWLKGGQAKRAYPTDAGTSAFIGKRSSTPFDEHYINHNPIAKQVGTAITERPLTPWNEFVVDIHPEDVGGIYISYAYSRDPAGAIFDRQYAKELRDVALKYKLPIVLFTPTGFYRMNIFEGKHDEGKVHMSTVWKEALSAKQLLDPKTFDGRLFDTTYDGGREWAESHR